MSSESDIRKYIRAITGVDDLSKSELCKVVSVDESEMTCEVISTDKVTYSDVRLMADNENSDKGIYFKPTVDSWVMITPQDEATYFISMYSEVDEIWLHGNQYDGLVKVGDLVTKLNNLENKVNSIISTFNSHVHTGVTTGGGSSAVSPTPVTGTLTPTQQTDIENPIVKHG